MRVAYTLEEAAVSAAVEKRDIIQAIKARELQARAVAGRAVVLKSDVQKWLERQPDFYTAIEGGDIPFLHLLV